MMKRLSLWLFLLLSVLTSGNVLADKGSGKIVIGDKEFSLDDLPTITFDDDGLSVTCRNSDNALPKTSYTRVSAIIFDIDTPGDVNGDYVVDVADLGTIVDVMAEGGNEVTADINSDGTVDVADIASLIDIMAAQARRESTIE